MIPEGLQTALNAIETSVQDNTVYALCARKECRHTDVGSFAAPILQIKQLQMNSCKD